MKLHYLGPNLVGKRNSTFSPKFYKCGRNLLQDTWAKWHGSFLLDFSSVDQHNTINFRQANLEEGQGNETFSDVAWALLRRLT